MREAEIGGRRALWRDGRSVALLMAASLTVMANATISPALPGLERLFASDPNAAILTRLLVPAPSLMVALVAPFAGLLADRFGRRRLLLGGVLLFVISGCAGLLLPGLPTIFASRLVLGIAVALVMTAQTALIGDYFEGQQRSAFAGLQVSARNFGGFLFISFAGWMALLSPRAPFAIYALPLVFLPFIWRGIVEPALPAKSRNGAVEAKGKAHRVWIPTFVALVLLQAVTNMLFFLMPTQLPFLFDVRGVNSAVMTGIALGVLTLAGGCFALLYARVEDGIGHGGVFAVGYGAMALGFLLLVLSEAVAFSLAGAAMIGSGYALVSPAFVPLALGIAPASRRGLAGGLLTASIFIGQFVSPLISTPWITSVGYEGVFFGAACLLAAMAMAATVIRLASSASSPSAPQANGTQPAALDDLNHKTPPSRISGTVPS
ncbi:MFS transporter [Geminicoccus harenae]|uniref:MFS transporter n=1 Tax=Geminicoccus harenae TaxID=2498453 RepID=UPI00168BAD11|nr:MFS transporter [Geminicoccus harenae]